MDLKVWLEKRAPDFLSTWQRFPLAIILLAVNAAIAIGSINNVEWLRDDVWGRVVLGLGAGTTFAVAGVYFVESRPDQRLWGIVLKLIVPFAAVVVCQITDLNWFVPWALPGVSLLWLSVSPFTRIERGEEREEQQHRFWWINHQALATAFIAAGGALIIWLGVFIIERSLSLLFGLEGGDIFYKWVLPFVTLFLTPVYWLSTLPLLDDLSAGALEKPDFTSRAVGFLGQFVLVPLLLIYGLILLAYAVQIVVTQHLPEGVIGWMVLGFVIAGAGTWLILHPPFMRSRGLVRLFRRSWFWLTLIPLALFFYAVWIRIDAYGLTPERILLVAGGVWAVVLAGSFLLRRGDIRMIPGLAGLILSLISIGPWNYANFPLLQHSTRLQSLLAMPGEAGASFPPKWSPQEVARARSSIDYLIGSEGGRNRLAADLEPYGIAYDTTTDSSYALLERLGQANASPADPGPTRHTLWRDMATQPVDVTRAPYYLRPVALYGSSTLDTPGMQLQVDQNTLWIVPSGQSRPSGVSVPLTDWIAAQTNNGLKTPWLDFTFAGTNYRLAVDSLELERTGDAPPTVTTLSGLLFANRPSR